jgi:phage-related protein
MVLLPQGQSTKKQLTTEYEDLFKRLNLGTLEDSKSCKITKDLGKYEAKIKYPIL